MELEAEDTVDVDALTATTGLLSEEPVVILLLAAALAAVMLAAVFAAVMLAAALGASDDAVCSICIAESDARSEVVGT